MSSDEQTTETPQTEAPQTPDRRPEVANEPPPVMRRISRESMDVARNLLDLKHPDGHFLDVASETLREVLIQKYEDGIINFYIGMLLALIWPRLAWASIGLAFLWPVAFLWTNFTNLHWKYSFSLPSNESDVVPWTLVWTLEIAAVGVAFCLVR